MLPTPNLLEIAKEISSLDYLLKTLQRPTRLYIKQCPHCGLKYFGKSSSENIENYQGSGKRWSKHLKKHGVEPIHLWNSDWYHDTSIKRFALKFSGINKIVESTEWANLKPENGLDGGGVLGGFKGPHTKETKEKMSKTRMGSGNNFFGKKHKNPEKCASFGMLGKAHSKKTKEKMSNSAIGKQGTNNGKKFGPRTEEQKKRISEATKAAMAKIPKEKLKQKVVMCPHCKKEGGELNMKRYHFDNCKSLDQ